MMASIVVALELRLISVCIGKGRVGDIYLQFNQIIFPALGLLNYHPTNEFLCFTCWSKDALGFDPKPDWKRTLS